MSDPDETESTAAQTMRTMRALEGAEVRFVKGADKSQVIGGLVEIAAHLIHEIARDEEGHALSARDAFDVLAGLIRQADPASLAMMDHLWSAN